jgi:hypothetical protein
MSHIVKRSNEFPEANINQEAKNNLQVPFEHLTIKSLSRRIMYFRNRLTDDISDTRFHNGILCSSISDCFSVIHDFILAHQGEEDINHILITQDYENGWRLTIAYIK